MAEFHLCSQFGSQSNSYFMCLAHKGNKVDDCGSLLSPSFIPSNSLHKWRLIVVVIIMTIIIIMTLFSLCLELVLEVTYRC